MMHRGTNTKKDQERAIQKAEQKLELSKREKRVEIRMNMLIGEAAKRPISKGHGEAVVPELQTMLASLIASVVEDGRPFNLVGPR